jgi:hypothetical protein
MTVLRDAIQNILTPLPIHDMLGGCLLSHGPATQLIANYATCRMIQDNAIAAESDLRRTSSDDRCRKGPNESSYVPSE